MSTSLIFIVIAVVLFILAGLGIDANGLDLVTWGLAAFAAGHLPGRNL